MDYPSGPPTEGPVQEPSYYFPSKRIIDYLASVAQSPHLVEPQYLDPPTERIALVTHDDEFDPRLHAREKDLGVESTWFLLTRKLNEEIPNGLDVQLHFDKEAGTIEQQIAAFRTRFGGAPVFNRTHRLLWRADNFDFPLLASHGIAVDSTRIGTRPYRPCIEGRLLPIWELPISVVDIPLNLKAIYNVGSSPSAPFHAGVSPVVILSHPASVCERHLFKSCFDEAIDAASACGYRFLNLSDFYDRYLRHASE